MAIARLSLSFWKLLLLELFDLYESKLCTGPWLCLPFFGPSHCVIIPAVSKKPHYLYNNVLVCHTVHPTDCLYEATPILTLL